MPGKEPYDAYDSEGYEVEDGYEQELYDEEDIEDDAYEPEEAYEQQGTYAQEPYDGYAPYEQPYEAYEQECPVRPPKQEPPPVISANATINLTSTLCAASGLLGVFFFFAEKRSRVVRRFAVQSTGLFLAMIFASVGLGILGMLLGWVPFIGGVLRALLWIVWAALFAVSVFQRVKLMLHAYRGEGYLVPWIGKYCRQFE